MVDFLGTSSYWQGGFTEEEQKYYEEHRLSQKGKHLWEQINRLYIIARNLCSTIMLLIALINLVAAEGINTFLFNVSIMIMLPYLLMLREILNFMMWNKLRNLLLGRVHSKLPICLKVLMMHLINMRLMSYLNFALKITRKEITIFSYILIDALH